MASAPLVDAHCHVHGYSMDEIRGFRNIRIAGVAMDLESSSSTLELARKVNNIDAFVGIHPWNLDKDSCVLDEVKKLAISGAAVGLGEVGVDGRFARAPFKEQLKIFTDICHFAVDRSLPLNVHALGGWSEVVKTSIRIGVKSLLLHWYTGPIELLNEIKNAGYYISINPAVIIQERHMNVLKEADIDIILTESDGPYSYRGLSLSPRSLPKLLRLIADVKGLSLEEAATIIYGNYLRFIGSHTWS